MSNAYDSEVDFVSAVTGNGQVAGTSYGVWRDSGSANPATYTAETSEIAKWGTATIGTGAFITYYFAPVSNWSSDEKSAFANSMALWAAVANLRFEEVADPADASFQIVRGSGGAYWKDVPYAHPKIGASQVGILPIGNAGDYISVDAAAYGGITGYTAANAGLQTLVHELGHMLGLGHGGPYDARNDVPDQSFGGQQFGAYDTKLWTTMSYILPEETGTAYFDDYPVKDTYWNGGQPVTPMMLDILAVQQLYGVATGGPLSLGGQVFGFHSNIKGLGTVYDFNFNTAPIVTIWDHGPHNTLDLSGFSQDAVIDMRPGTFSSAAGLKNNIGIAFGTMIDTAVGGSGNDKIVASDVNSTLRGGAGRDMLIGGAGNDILTGGADPDRIDGGGGHDLVRDALANMNNDEIFHFGLATTIEAQGALVGRDHLLAVTDPDGNTTLGMGGIEMLLAGTFAGGDFMAAARNFGSDGMHTDVQFVPWLPRLYEGVSVSQDQVNGIANTPFMTGDGVVKFSVTLQAAISAFDNSLGYYTVAADGTISSVNMLFADTHGSSGTTLTLPTVGNGLQVGFFLVQNGFNQFGSLPHDLSFVTQNGQPANANGGQAIFLDSASLGILNGATVFHSIQALNPGDALQVLSGSANGGKDLQVGFEDLPHATGDNDFQDVVIQIHTDRDGVLLLG